MINDERMGEKSYCVYVHIFPNGKRYVGQCQEPAERRWKSGSGYRRQSLINSAILKYGWDNVQHEILYSGLALAEAHEKEVQLIKCLHTNSLRGGFGYNLSDGGESGSKGYKHTAQTRQLLSELNSGENNAFYGKRHPEETRQKISAAHKGKVMPEESRRKMSESKSGENHPQYGKHCSVETKQKLRKANLGEKHPQFGMKGRNNPHAKTYLCVETGEIYKSLFEIKDMLHLPDVSHISSVCIGKRKSAYGFSWEYISKNKKTEESTYE